MTEPTRHVQRPTAVQGGLTHCACGEPWPCTHSAEGRWKQLKDYLTANAEAMAAEADDQENNWPSLDLGRVLRARAEIFALVRQYMGEIEATS